ncbi:hypothetical protein ABPG77_000519 [Micractinium sp. CCAP 211/92]
MIPIFISAGVAQVNVLLQPGDMNGLTLVRYTLLGVCAPIAPGCSPVGPLNFAQGQPVHFRPSTEQQEQGYIFTAVATARLPQWPELTSRPSKPYALYIPPATCACGAKVQWFSLQANSTNGGPPVGPLNSATTTISFFPTSAQQTFSYAFKATTTATSTTDADWPHLVSPFSPPLFFTIPTGSLPKPPYIISIKPSYVKGHNGAITVFPTPQQSGESYTFYAYTTASSSTPTSYPAADTDWPDKNSSFSLPYFIQIPTASQIRVSFTSFLPGVTAATFYGPDQIEYLQTVLGVATAAGGSNLQSTAGEAVLRGVNVDTLVIFPGDQTEAAQRFAGWLRSGDAWLQSVYGQGATVSSVHLDFERRLSLEDDALLAFIATHLGTARAAHPEVAEAAGPGILRWEDIQLKLPLGRGTAGKVYLGSLGPQQVALKVLLSAEGVGLTADLQLPNKAMKELQEEAAMMCALRHANVARFFGICILPPSIVTERCLNGSLRDVLRRGAVSPEAAALLTWKLRLHMAMEAAKGLEHLHSRLPTIVHGGLKSSNVLVDEHWHVKVSDAGLCEVLWPERRMEKDVMWLAPEVLKGKPSSCASDVFSLGLIRTLVLQGERPQVPALESLPNPEGGNLFGLDSYCQLIRECWAQRPTTRPSSAVVVGRLAELLDGLGAAGKED